MAEMGMFNKGFIHASVELYTHMSYMIFTGVLLAGFVVDDYKKGSKEGYADHSRRTQEQFYPERPVAIRNIRRRNMDPWSLAADETGLTGLWFDGARYYAAGLAAQHEFNSSAFLGMPPAYPVRLPFVPTIR